MTSPDSMFPGLNLADVLKCTLVAVIHEGGGVLEQCTVLYCTVLDCTVLEVCWSTWRGLSLSAARTNTNGSLTLLMFQV